MIARTWLGRTCAVVLMLALSQVSIPVAQATPHLVGSQEVVQRLLDGAKSREQKVRLFEEALATPEASRQARSMGLNTEKLRAAIPHLSDEELADLAQRATRAKDVVAGHYHGDDGLVVLGIVLLLVGLAVLIAVSANSYDDCYCY